jgi:dolichyl-phosphate-mannose-protein mannosyltransferase
VHEQGPSQAFSANWWFWLACTGLGLGATASVKWVGLFTIAWVGSLTILQLWTLLGDTKNISAITWIKHFAARAWCLIGIPVTFYMAMFAIHFTCLRNPGEGDGFMSSEFQSTLNSKGMNDVPADVAFGSKVSIRHWNTQGGYLHSHASMYATGSKQQQITLYPHKDENNLWFLENQTYPEGGAGLTGFEEMDPQWIQDGSIIKLYHISTDRRLHSHDHRPPVTEADWQNEVSAYGHKGFEGDANDMFRVEIVKHLSDGPVAKERVRTIQTKFKLVHTMSGCVLFSHKVKLPAWGFEQQEVTCAKGATLPNSIWYIESNEHPKLGANAERVNYKKPGFVGKFWELQKVMWKTNAGLVESHAWDSRPESWPILRRGINFWGKDHRQVYLIGNPLIWWTSTAAIGLYALFKGLAVLRWQRGYRDYAITNFRRFDYEVGVAVLAWAFHYFPFFLMQRQLFLHHYLPALYFAVVVLCQVFDYVFFRIKAFGLKRIPLAGWTVAVVFLTLSAVVYGLYSPLVYGNTWTKSSCRQVKLFDTWDWDCNTFPDKYDDYSNFASKKVAQATPSAPVAAAPPAQQQQQQQQQQQPIVHQAAAQQPLVQQPIKEEAKQPEPEIDNAMITPQAKPGNLLVGTEEHVEYRDQDGNILDPEQVKALEGQVSFETKYETRYRMIDEDGNELPGDYPVEQAAVPENPEAVELETVVIEVDQDGNTIQAGKDDTKVQTVVVEVDEVPEDAEKVQTVVVEVEVDQEGNTIQFNDNGEPIKTETVYVEEEASPSQAAVDAEEAPVKQSG